MLCKALFFTLKSTGLSLDLFIVIDIGGGTGDWGILFLAISVVETHSITLEKA